MKRIVLIVSALLLCLAASAQYLPKNPSKLSLSAKDSLMMHMLLRINQKSAPAFKLYPTENIWTFLELDTASGRIWQVQFSLDNTNKYSVPLSMEVLPEYSDIKDTFNGRYELYKTQNLYNFILLDTATGATWQVQWSQDVKSRGIMPINPLY